MNIQRKKAGLGFWFLWVLASTVGMPFGFILCFLLLGALPFSILGIMIGTTVGTLQWIVLRKRVPGVVLWILASAAGFGIAAFIGDFKSFTAHMHWGMALLTGAIATGILQWLILRRRIARAGWWVAACTIGWLISLKLVGEFFLGVDDADALNQMVMFGAVPGAITGITLVWLLRKPLPAI